MQNDFYEVTTPATEQPIDFPTASEWCRDIELADTALVTALIESDVEFLESMTNRVFVKRSITGKFAEFCLSPYENYPFVEIRRSPLVSISEVRLNGVALDSSDYLLKESSSFARLWYLGSENVDTDLAYPIEIDFVAGYGDGSAISITSISRVGSLVTVVTSSAHNFVSNIFALIAGAVETEYNGNHQITVVDGTTFTYVISSTPSTPATGTLTVEWVIPELIKTMVEQMVLFHYENRGDISTDARQQIPFVAKQIIKKYRIVNTYG